MIGRAGGSWGQGAGVGTPSGRQCHSWGKTAGRRGTDELLAGLVTDGLLRRTEE